MKAKRPPDKSDDPEPLSVRERILASAGQLFYEDGIRAIGVDTVVARSGVAKTSLYRHFKSKDELIAAIMEEWDADFWHWWDAVESKYQGNPKLQLTKLVEGVVAHILKADFRGCPFQNVATEFPHKDHPGRMAAAANKKELYLRLKAIATNLKSKEPAKASEQLLFLINGLYATGMIEKSHIKKDVAVEAALRIVNK